MTENQFEAILAPIPELALIVPLNGEKFLDIPGVGPIWCFLNQGFAQALLMNLDYVKKQLRECWKSFERNGRRQSVYTILLSEEETRPTECHAETIVIHDDGHITMTNVQCVVKPAKE